MAVTSTSFAQPDSDSDSDTDHARTCPTFVHGAKLTVSNIDRGIQVKVTTPQSENVAELRQATRKVAGFIQAHERASGTASAIDPGEAGSDAEPFPAVQMSVKDIPGGTQVEVRAEAGTSVSDLRDQGKVLKEVWNNSSCINQNKHV